jgi:hypothetical protein
MNISLQKLERALCGLKSTIEFFIGAVESPRVLREGKHWRELPWLGEWLMRTFGMRKLIRVS